MTVNVLWDPLHKCVPLDKCVFAKNPKKVMTVTPRSVSFQTHRYSVLCVDSHKELHARQCIHQFLTFCYLLILYTWAIIVCTNYQVCANLLMTHTKNIGDVDLVMNFASDYSDNLKQLWTYC